MLQGRRLSVPPRSLPSLQSWTGVAERIHPTSDLHGEIRFVSKVRAWMRDVGRTAATVLLPRLVAVAFLPAAKNVSAGEHLAGA